jgi:FkbM family methyltransferase
MKFLRRFNKVAIEPTLRHPSTIDSFRKLVSLGVQIDSVVDVGVMYGTSKLIQAFPNAHHYLIESVSDFYPEITKNYSQVRHTIVPFGASSENGLRNIAIERDSHSNIVYSHIMGHSISNVESRTIQMMTLDSIANIYDIQGRILVKIDVDGDELEVLAGGLTLLSKTLFLILEVTTATFFERVEFMDKIGYQLFDVVDICYYKELLHQMDLIFVEKNYYVEMALNPWAQGDFDATQYEEL